MVGYVNKDFFKSDQSIMLENLEARGGGSSRNSGTINTYSSQPSPSSPEPKYTKRGFSELTRSEKVRGVVEVHEYLGCVMEVLK